jgi:hypothetical protein
MSPSSQVWFEGDNNLFSKVVAANAGGQVSPRRWKRESTFSSQDQGSTRDTTSTASGSWSIAESPQAKGALTKNFLGGATCVSPSDCWAVGFSAAELFSGLHQTLIEHWDGSSWHIVESPNTGPTLINNLFGATCNSSTDCWAVGGSVTPAGDAVQTLIEHWDGTAWSIIPSPNPPNGIFNAFTGVTCTSASQCWAVGYAYVGSAFQTLIEKWDGNSWTIVASPNGDSTHDNALNGVICNSTSDCWTVGGFATSSAVQTLTEHWDGSSWSIVSSADMPGAPVSALFSVSCSSPSQCWAVGQYSVPVPIGSGGNVVLQNLIERWNGSSWSIEPSAPFPLQNNFFDSVTCNSESDCWTVGVIWPQAAGQASPTNLIEHWDGAAWTTAIPPDTSATGGNENDLYAVTCASGSDCWAMGLRYELVFGVLYEQTVAEHWNGTSWAIVASPNNGPIEAYNSLNSVTCLSANQCWAVGSYTGDGLIDQTVTKYWDGDSWTIVPSANATLPGYSYLDAVTCVSASDCWAVGGFGPGNPHTLTEHWDGSKWTIVSSPDIPVDPTEVNNGNFLNGVACLSATDCWAVGYGFTNGITAKTLIEHWNGTSWSITTSASPSAQHNELNAVTCNAVSDCWAVGSSNDVNGNVLTLVEHWNGASWSVTDSPNIDGAWDNELSAVSCAGSSDCWAVGFYDTSVIYQTLIEHWDGTSWTIVSSPNTASTSENFLTGVSCFASSGCMAVGLSNDGIVNATLIERWDGTEWNIIGSPNENAHRSDFLTSIACASGNDCVATGGFDNGIGEFQGLIEHYTAAPATLSGVASRKIHGATGAFDIELPLAGSVGVECRSGGANGNYQLVFTFADPLSSVTGATVTSGAGSVATANVDPTDAHNYIVNLAGVTNGQTITVSLTNAADSTGKFSATVPISMGVLIGDTTGDRTVNSADIAQTKSQSGQSLTRSNFREDLTADGNLNSGDITLVKSKSGTGLP